MRTIKFRAWDKEKMIYYPKWSTLSDKRTLVFDEDVSSYVDDSDWNEKVELMQFTGLLDKNGKEIYEEDVVNFRRHSASLSNKKCGIVKYSDEYARYQIEWFDNEIEKERNYHSITDMDLREIEVIGNIYENPDLLN